MTAPLVSDVGHIVLPVRDMPQALRFYRDLLGLTVQGEEDPVWTVIAANTTQLTLYRRMDLAPVALGARGDETPFLFHVADFGKAADLLESGGVKVKRKDPHSGVVWDPFGNVLGLHDHLETDG